MRHRISSVDIQVGRRVRSARLAKCVSQQKLAAAIGVTFQQVQKYEKGVNRLGSGRLHAIAGMLDVPMSYFYEGLEPDRQRDGDSVMEIVSDALSTKEGIRIALALTRIENETTRRRIADLLEAMIEEQRAGVRTLRNA